MSCRHIAEATALAQQAGMYRLSTILAQADGDSEITLLISQQLQLWTYHDSADLVPPAIMSLYRLLGAEYLDVPGGRSILAGLGWKRALSILFWYGCSDGFLRSVGGSSLIESESGAGTLQLALRKYRFLLESTGSSSGMLSMSIVDPPDSPIAPLRIGVAVRAPGHKNQHGLYSLLQAVCQAGDGHVQQTTDVMNALRPEGFTADSLDYRASFLVLAMLECCEGRGTRPTAETALLQSQTHACIVRMHFIAQLCSENAWKWAVVVAMKTLGSHRRSLAVKNILDQWVGQKDPMWEPEQDADSIFFVERLGVPPSWILQAAACRCGYLFQHEREARFWTRAWVTSSLSGKADLTLLKHARSSIVNLAPRIYTTMGLSGIEEHINALRSTDLGDQSSTIFEDFVLFRTQRDDLQRDLSTGGCPIDEQERIIGLMANNAARLLDKLDAQHALHEAVGQGQGDREMQCLNDLGTLLFKFLESVCQDDHPSGLSDARRFIHHKCILQNEKLKFLRKNQLEAQ